jgi:hypothetical protein
MRIKYGPNKDWRFRILCTSDEHIDHTYTDRKLIKKHLEEAKVNNWPCIKMGDLFCAMQGKKDPRSSRVALQNVFNDKEEYFDALVDYAYDFLLPYKDQYALQALGNHETSIISHNETHLLKRLVRRLNEVGSPVQLGAYSGYLKLLFESKPGGKRKSINIKYLHGSGGSAPVTKGVIKTNRRAVSFPDANIVLSGHTHEAFVLPIPQERLSEQCRPYMQEQLHVQIPSYKDEVIGKVSGFPVEKEFPLKTVGAYWLEFKYNRQEDKIKYDAFRV